MWRILHGASALALSAGAAMAADVITYEPAQAPSAYNVGQPADWTGSYAGVTVGYGFGGGTTSHDGLIGGVYGGFNFQASPNIVLGIEGDVTATGKSGAGGTENPWNGTVRGRFGVASGQNLFYGTAGFAVGGVKAGGASATESGWTGGVGIERAIGESTTGRVELRRTDLGTSSVGGGTSFKSTDLMAGLGVRF